MKQWLWQLYKSKGCLFPSSMFLPFSSLHRLVHRTHFHNGLNKGLGSQVKVILVHPDTYWETQETLRVRLSPCVFIQPISKIEWCYFKFLLIPSLLFHVHHCHLCPGIHLPCLDSYNHFFTLCRILFYQFQSAPHPESRMNFEHEIIIHVSHYSHFKLYTVSSFPLLLG